MAIVTESFLPTINGVTNSVIQVNRSLVSQGHQVVILAPEVNSRPKFFEGSEVIGLPAINLQKVLPVAVPNFLILKRVGLQAQVYFVSQKHHFVSLPFNDSFILWR